MDIFDITAVLITASALSAFINHRPIKLPSTIGLESSTTTDGR